MKGIDNKSTRSMNKFVIVPSFAQCIGLKKDCAEVMVVEMNVENCLQLRAYAQRYGFEAVIAKSSDVIFQNLHDVLQQEEFSALEFEEAFNFLEKSAGKVSWSYYWHFRLSFCRFKNF